MWRTRLREIVIASGSSKKREPSQQPGIVRGTMKRKKKAKSPQRAKQTPEQRRDEKVMRLAHHILTKTIEPANLQLEDVVDVLTILAKAIVLSNTSDDDLEDRSGMIAWIEERFVMGLDEIDPLAEIPPHVWIVPPQGLITEPFGILWSGSRDDDEDEDKGDDESEGVQVVLGADLETLRAEIAEAPDGVIVTEGVEGVAVIDPEWDGAPTVTCANPQCGKVHDAHLSVAENLFQQAIERRRQVGAPN